MRSRGPQILGVLTVVLAFPACETAPGGAMPPRQSPGIANLQPQDGEIVAERAADARCSRENQCSDVGPRSRYASRDACLSAMRARAQADMRLSSCPRGIDAQKIDYCISEILGEGCGDPRADFVHLEACKTTSLCR